MGTVFRRCLPASASRAGHLRFTFRPNGDAAPYIVLDASRATVITHNPKNVTFPAGKVTIDKKLNEVYGWSSERQEYVSPPSIHRLVLLTFSATFSLAKTSLPRGSRAILSPGSASRLFRVASHTTARSRTMCCRARERCSPAT